MSDDDEMAAIAIQLPGWMLNELREVAEARGCTVTEHIRRCVSLERVLFLDPKNRLTLHRTNGTELTVTLDSEGWITGAQHTGPWFCPSCGIERDADAHGEAVEPQDFGCPRCSSLGDLVRTPPPAPEEDT